MTYDEIFDLACKWNCPVSEAAAVVTAMSLSRLVEIHEKSVEEYATAQQWMYRYCMTCGYWHAGACVSAR